MLLFHTQFDLKKFLLTIRQQGQSIGFVPTMGALHQGHISLLNRAKNECHFTVCSIFVNPTQFNDSSDLAKYPRTIESDIRKLTEAGCDVLYLPDSTDVYKGEVKVFESFHFNGLDIVLEGASRPGHFAGVAQVVKLLLEITQPEKIFMGQKDYQQWLIIKRMGQTLQIPVEVVRCPIFREENGLAMSSRNIRLSERARDDASIIYKTLQWAAGQLQVLPVSEIEEESIRKINCTLNFTTDYFKILYAHDLTPLTIYDTKEETIIVAAVLAEGVRLLDNLLIETL